MGCSVWLLWRSGRLRDQPGPFRPGCRADEMVREAQLREQRGSLAQRLARNTLATALVADTLYAMYWSINAAT